MSYTQWLNTVLCPDTQWLNTVLCLTKYRHTVTKYSIMCDTLHTVTKYSIMSVTHSD